MFRTAVYEPDFVFVGAPQASHQAQIVDETRRGAGLAGHVSKVAALFSGAASITGLGPDELPTLKVGEHREPAAGAGRFTYVVNDLPAPRGAGLPERVVVVFAFSAFRHRSSTLPFSARVAPTVLSYGLLTTEHFLARELSGSLCFDLPRNVLAQLFHVSGKRVRL